MATWSEAFAAQARSDLDVYDLLTASTVPSSHRLHYLQMWLEKLCKAYLWMPNVRLRPRLRAARDRRMNFGTAWKEEAAPKCLRCNKMRAILPLSAYQKCASK